ncbi:MAG: hypothetical protein OXE17_01435 [Chloroflexi bacterium]|nr:hypothetical protein [Chloroflexota bacterium]
MSSVQSLRITDALRCTLLNAPRGPNLACPGPTLNISKSRYNGASLWRSAVLQPKGQVALAHWQGTRLSGLASARTRSGHRAWELDGLYLPSVAPSTSSGVSASAGEHCRELSEGEAEALALLEETFRAVGERAGERVFLRVTGGSPVIPLARRSGFIAVCGETLVEGPVLSGANGSSAHDSQPLAGALRPRLPSDEYGVFQLYCAATPIRVRQAMGLTFEQWRDAREPGSRGVAPLRQQEWIVEESSRIQGWVKLSGRAGSAAAEVMAHPDHPELLYQLVAFASSRTSRLRWLVPDYQAPIADRLLDRGGRAAGEYNMMVKMVTVPAMQYGMAPVEA